MARAALVLVPLLVAVVIAIGLRLGAGEGARAAVVYAAPRAEGSDALAWQIETFRDYLTSRETTSVRMHVKVDGKIDLEAESNSDGAAEISIPTAGKPSFMEIRAEDDGEILASGALEWEDLRWENEPRIAWLEPTRASGPLAIHVAPWGGKLVSGFPGEVTLLVEGAPPGDIEIEAEGEESASIARAPGKPCSSGMTTLSVLPLLQAAGLTVRAHTKSGARGEWFGALPVALGAMHVGSVDVDDHTTITAPGNAGRAYVEIDDDRGRVWATTLVLEGDAADPRPHADLRFPSLSGDRWLVVSPDPRGAETLASTTVARRIHAGKGSLDACDAATRLAPSARGFPRWIALDGLVGRRRFLAEQRSRGRMIALAGLASGGTLELFLIVRASQRAQRDIQRLEGRRLGFLELLIGLMVTMLGFAVLAAVVGFFGQ